MVDALSTERRSENMRRIRSKGTKPELVVRRLVHSIGYRFHVHVAGLPGRPDLVFSSLQKIVDVRGCFWHQHKGCIDAHVPKSKVAYWRRKLRSNLQRDKKNLSKLHRLGWRVLIVWECETIGTTLQRLRLRLRKFLKAR